MGTQRAELSATEAEAKLREEGTLDYANAIGNVGSVYLPIQPNRKGIGQVEVMIQGRIRIVKALTDHSKRIGNRAAVQVKSVIDQQTVLVELMETTAVDAPPE